jgi:uncharacterized membrane protein
MRASLLIVGAILVVIGLVLAFVPLIQSISQDTVANTTTESVFQGYAWNITGFAITGSIPITISWTASGPVKTELVICSGGGFNGYFYCAGTPSWPSNQSGTSGTASFSAPSGSSLLFAMYSQNATTGHVNGELAESTIGLIIVIVGIILLIVGVVLKGKHTSHVTTPPNGSEPPPT